MNKGSYARIDDYSKFGPRCRETQDILSLLLDNLVCIV